MSKTFKKRQNKHNEDAEEDYYGHVKHSVNKTKKKRFDRALKTMDVDALMDDELYEVEYGEWGD